MIVIETVLCILTYQTLLRCLEIFSTNSKLKPSGDHLHFRIERVVLVSLNKKVDIAKFYSLVPMFGHFHLNRFMNTLILSDLSKYFSCLLYLLRDTYHWVLHVSWREHTEVGNTEKVGIWLYRRSDQIPFQVVLLPNDLHQPNNFPVSIKYDKWTSVLGILIFFLSTHWSCSSLTSSYCTELSLSFGSEMFRSLRHSAIISDRFGIWTHIWLTDTNGHPYP